MSQRVRTDTGWMFAYERKRYRVDAKATGNLEISVPAENHLIKSASQETEAWYQAPKLFVRGGEEG